MAQRSVPRSLRRLAVIGVPALVAGALALPSQAARVPHVLVYDQTLGFHHQSIEVAEEALRKIAKLDRPFTLQISQDPKVLSKATLARTDVVMWLSNTAARGRVSPFTDAQEKAYEQWMLCGGGHVGVHAAVDSYNDAAFPAYVKANGAIFTSHPITVTSALDDSFHNEEEGWGEPQHTIRVNDRRSPITAPWHDQATFQVHEELYRYDRDPSKVVTGYRQLLGHGGVNDPQGQVMTQVMGSYPENMALAWTGSYAKKNRTFYTNLGHSVLAWKNADFLRHVVNGITWTAEHKVQRGCLKRAGFR